MAGEFPRTVEEIFGDFNGRRKALITALTTDFEEFFQQFNPVGGALCLYGFPNGLWEVNFPDESEPADLPQAISGINIARDEMQEKNLLALVAVHSDAWLLSLAFYCGSMAGFDKADSPYAALKKQNKLPTDLWQQTDLPQLFGPEGVPKDEDGDEDDKYEDGDEDEHDEYEDKDDEYEDRDGEYRDEDKDEDDKYEDEDKNDDDYEGDDEGSDQHEEGDSLCGACGKKCYWYQFWVRCELCKRWFHDNCVEIVRVRGEHLDKYKCWLCVEFLGKKTVFHE